MFTSDDGGDFTHNICEMDRGVHIKNSFDEWKSKVGQPFDPSKVQETQQFTTNLTTRAKQDPLIVEEEIKGEEPI